jgi:polysaccharide biosynthesis PFTS motif protein
MGKRFVFFETASALYNPLINKYLKDGYAVYFFKSDKKFISRDNIKLLVESGKLVDASKIIFQYELYRRAAFFAHENLDILFEKYYSKCPSIKNMVRLLDFPDIVNMFRKELLLNLEGIYEVQLKINEILEGIGTAADAHFVPADNFNIHSDGSSPLGKNIRIIIYRNFRIRLKNIFERLITDDFKSPRKGLLLLFYPIYLFFRKFRGISNDKAPEKYRVGIMITRHPRSMFGMNYLTETIFIDEPALKKEDVLFIDENGSMNIDGYKKRGWNFIRMLDGRETISLDFFYNKVIKSFLPVWLKTIFLSLFKEPFFIRTKYRILQDYILWNMFAENYSIDSYVRKMLPDNISKTHILGKNGVKTWYIFPDNTSIDYHLDWDRSKRNQTLYSFMHYDNAIVYGNLVEVFFKKHRNFIKKYIKNGIFFSQIVKDLQRGRLKSVLPSLIREKHLPDKLIGVFDTTYVDNGPVKVKDGIKFGNDILRLLEDFPDIGVVFKAIKWPEEVPYLNEIYDELGNHPRCLLFYMWGKEGISASEVIAVSGLVVSCVYTSTTAEALAAKKRAIYYDPAGADIGDKYLFNNFPNFVAHDYEELKKLVRYWLYEVTDEEFEDFLNKYVKDEMDPYMDFGALTRISRLLTGEDK